MLTLCNMHFSVEAFLLHVPSLLRRFMCRFFSGFFFRHPLLQGFDYYWRVEPGVKFYCNLQQDPFVTMEVGRLIPD